MTTRKPTKKASAEAPAAVSDEDLLTLCRQKVRTMLASEPYDLKLGSHLAWLENMAAKTENERAKIVERYERRLRAISWPHAVAWARRLSEPEFAKFIREVEGGGKGSVLG